MNSHIVLEDGEIAASKVQKQSAFKKFFSNLMRGTDCSCTALATTAKKDRPIPNLEGFEFSISDLKSLSKKTKPFTAPGFDGIKYGIYIMFPDLLLPSIHSICSRSIMGDAPVQWLGSKLHPLYKNKGSLHDMSIFRDILLADTSGKLSKRLLRSKCVPFLESFILDSMCGGFQKRGVDFCSHFIRSRRSIAEVQKHNFASLFLDVKSAFAGVLREFALHDSHPYSDSEICCLFDRFGFGPEVFHDFLVTFKDASALDQAGVPKGVSDQIAPYFFDTFFCVDDSEDCVVYKNGTGAGTPIADLMFTFITSRVLRKCEERLSDLELLDVFEFGNAAILGPHIGEKYKDLGASYVDDCVFYATSSCPRNCVS